MRTCRSGPKARPIRDKFEEKFKVDPVTGCWNWVANTFRCGYGQFRDRSPDTGRWTMRPANRVAYEIYVGPIPEGLHVCHHCDNKLCVNPKHLFTGTRKDNYQDLVRKGRHPGQRKTHCKRGHPLSADNIKFYPSKPTHRVCLTCIQTNKRRSREKMAA